MLKPLNKTYIINLEFMLLNVLPFTFYELKSLISEHFPHSHHSFIRLGITVDWKRTIIEM